MSLNRRFAQIRIADGRFIEQMTNLTSPLGKAFDDSLGRDPSIKSWAKNAGAREAFKLARDRLNELVRLRNQIAHGSADPDIRDTEVEEAAALLGTLGKALVAKARSKSA